MEARLARLAQDCWLAFSVCGDEAAGGAVGAFDDSAGAKRGLLEALRRRKDS